jgi:cadmium resistance protein CadD (predicted permease)
MNWVIGAILTGASAFVATNIDDILVLTLFFAQADNPSQHRSPRSWQT